MLIGMIMMAILSSLSARTAAEDIKTGCESAAWSHINGHQMNTPLIYALEPGNNRTSLVILEKAKELISEAIDDENMRLHLSVRWIPGAVYRVSPSDIISMKMIGTAQKYTSFEVTYRTNQWHHTAQVQLLVDIEKKIPVAARRIMYGEILDHTNLTYDWTSVQFQNSQLVESAEHLYGKTLRRSLATGQPIRRADVAAEFLIHAGEDVSLLFEEDGIMIAITAQARQDGELDESIILYSRRTRMRYLGRVVRPGVAKWEQTL